MRCRNYSFKKSGARAVLPLVALFLLYSGCLCASCGGSGESILMNSEAQKISGPLEIGEEWTEIAPPAPLQSVTRIHRVSVRTSGVDTFDESDETNRTLKFKNGKSGKVEAALLDDAGNSYELQLTGIGGAGGGFYLGKKHAARRAGEPPVTEPDFPPGHVLTKLKIRSDVPIHCEKIEWIAEIQK